MITICEISTKKRVFIFEYKELDIEAKVNAMNKLHTTKREVLQLKYYTHVGNPYMDIPYVTLSL